MRMKGAVASMLSLGAQNVQIDECSNSCVGGRKGDLKPFDQRGDGNDRLTQQEMGNTPYGRVLARAACLQMFLPSFGNVSKLAQQVHGMAT